MRVPIRQWPTLQASSLASLVCFELRLCTTLQTRKYRAHNDVRVTVVSIISVVAFLNALLILSALYQMCATRRCYRDIRSWCPWFLKWIARELIASRHTPLYACETVHLDLSKRIQANSSVVDLVMETWERRLTFLFVESMREPVSTLCIRPHYTWDWMERTTLQWSETCPENACAMCCPFGCCGNLGLSMPAEVGMSSFTMSPVCLLCVSGPVSKHMAYLVNVPSHGISCHSLYLCLSIFARPCPPHFVIIWCMYTTSASFMSCLFDGVSIELHLKSVHIPAGWRGYVQSCYAGVEEWTNKFQLDLEVRNIYIIKTASFFCFHCSCMMISEIVAELIFLCYLPSELCAIEGVAEWRNCSYLFI
jgi:hypothetical protein